MARFVVTIREEVEAYSQETAALEVARLLQTNRPVVFDVTPAGRHGKTVFVEVERGNAKRVA